MFSLERIASIVDGIMVSNETVFDELIPQRIQQGNIGKEAIALTARVILDPEPTPTAFRKGCLNERRCNASSLVLWQNDQVIDVNA